MGFKHSLAAGGKSARLDLYGVVGVDFYDTDVIEAVDSIGQVDELELRLNSPGGDVFQGLAIYHRLSDHPANKTAIVDGLAGSVMSVIMLAADNREIRKGGRVMIHEPSGFVRGNAKHFRQFAEQMEVTTNEVADIYSERTGKMTADEAKELMAAETWMAAKEAVDRGFAHKISGQMAMCTDWELLLEYRNVPLDMQQKPSFLESAKRRLRIARAIA